MEIKSLNMLENATYRKIREHNWLDIVRKESNYSQFWHRIRDNVRKTGSGNTNIVIGFKPKEFVVENELLKNSVLWCGGGSGSGGLKMCA